MKRLQATQYERMPNGEQQRNLRRFVGSCRFVVEVCQRHA
jgi:putative transposase